MKFNNIEATEKVILGLLSNADNLSALNSGAYLTTRLPNIIFDLRNAGLEIDIEFQKAPSGKRYGIYKLTNTKTNLKKTYELLERVQRKISGK